MAHCVDSIRRIRGADVDMLRRYVFYSRLIVAVRNIVNARLQQVSKTGYNFYDSTSIRRSLDARNE